mmetsp:Transcript_144388/g.462601  ORF Transcript_144388/g.462601 Transcript_144388/m.462601 type:complete len:216 (+) Transcript_144388:1744-2391(+)
MHGLVGGVRQPVHDVETDVRGAGAGALRSGGGGEAWSGRLALDIRRAQGRRRFAQGRRRRLHRKLDLDAGRWRQPSGGHECGFVLCCGVGPLRARRPRGVQLAGCISAVGPRGCVGRKLWARPAAARGLRRLAQCCLEALPVGPFAPLGAAAAPLGLHLRSVRVACSSGGVALREVPGGFGRGALSEGRADCRLRSIRRCSEEEVRVGPAEDVAH